LFKHGEEKMPSFSFMRISPAVLIISCSTLLAQDARHVTEPVYPPICQSLTARLSAPGGRLSSESRFDTERIQKAMDSCSAGMGVQLKPDGHHNVFLTGPIELRPGVVLLVDAGVALFASRNPRDYDLSPGSCGVVDEKGHGCRTWITAERAPGSGIMGEGALDGRGGARLIGQNVSWWDLAKEAKVKDLAQSVPRMMVVRQSNNFVLYKITMRNSPNFHVSVERTDGFTAWGVKIRTPKTARNTDGIDPSSSKNVTIIHCDIATGDDSIAVKSGAAGPSSNITIEHNRFYYGHGMSIGSGTDGGVSAVKVLDLTMDGGDNGIRIKSDRSRGGLVRDISYENVCMKNVTNPIVLTTMYTTRGGDKLPVYKNISLKNVRSVTPGWVTLLGLDAGHKIGVSFDNVSIDGIEMEKMRVENAVLSVGPRPGNLMLSGSNVSVSRDISEPNAPMDCRHRFIPLQNFSRAPAAAVAVPPEDRTLYVAASGTGDYYSIQRAIDVAPAEGAVISVAPGIYREVLTIDKPNISIRSPYPDAARTVIVFDKSAGTAGGTFNSATVNVKADGFAAENLTFANDFNAMHLQEFQGSQALALLVTGDRAVFRNMRLLGNQDTLYAGSKNCDFSKGSVCIPARQYFWRCYIEGNVDFIFGDGKALFEDCEIRSMQHSIGFITAQGKHYSDQDSLFVFNRCKLTAQPGVSHVWLGRPWRSFASVVFLNTEMDGHIEPAGWREWHPGETKSIETAFYAEYGSSGAGASPAARDPHTKKLSAAEAARYAKKRFLTGHDGWNP
jgi:polygalacturonase